MTGPKANTAGPLVGACVPLGPRHLRHSTLTQGLQRLPTERERERERDIHTETQTRRRGNRKTQRQTDRRAHTWRAVPGSN